MINIQVDFRSSTPSKLALTRIFTTPRTSSSDNKVSELETIGVPDMLQARAYKRRFSI
jgi:hypothetical protein